MSEVAKRTLKADVVILGGGGAGLAAALTARENGAQIVILLEKRGAVGGNTTMSSGCFATDSPAQQRAAIDARADYFFKIATEFSHWKLNPRILRAFLNKSGETIRWLENKGLFFEVHPMYPNQIMVWHQARNIKAGGRNAEVMRVMLEECQRQGVEIRVKTPAKKLLLDPNGHVTGVLAENEGREITFAAENVIVATGGFGGNKELLKKYSWQYRSNMLCDGLLHNGDGLLMAMEAGADTEGLGLLLVSGPQVPNAVMLYWDDPPNVKASPLMAIALEPNTVWVNKRGERFVDETIGYNHYVSSNSINRQPDNICFTIMDHKLVQHMETNGLIMGLQRFRFDMRAKMPGLERELKVQTQGLMSVEQVDPELCSGCGLCVNACPAESIYLDTAPADKNEYSACRYSCPAGVDMRRYFNLLNLGKYEEANDVLREFLPLPAVTGRVCPHYCESECARNDVDEAVNINAIERFVADYWLKEKAKPSIRKYAEKIAIVGSGPAGLSCAYFLTRMGYPVTVFESAPALGGMLRNGIPDFRLPKPVLDEQISYIKDMGVQFKTGVTIGKDIGLAALQKDYRAVFFATGNQLSRRIDLNGSELNGVLWGLDFLRDINSRKKISIGNKVVVIGGGNVAIDVALSALRMGAKEVQIACLETGEQVPAFRDELVQAVTEGIKINEGWGPQKITGDGNKVTGIELVRCTRVFDAKGRFSPTYDSKTIKTLAADTIILAIGQSPDLSLVSGELKIEKGMLRIDPVTLETSKCGIFAGGDLAGANSVVKAIADGKSAASSIDRFIKGKDLRQGREQKPSKVQKPPKEGIPKTKRLSISTSAIDKIAGNFAEIKLGFSEENARQEAQRCMTCGSRSVMKYVPDCRLCKSCETTCPVQAIYVAPVKKVEPYVKIADTLEEIAQWIGADPQTLKKTIAEYNEACDKNYDPVFNKDRKYLLPLRTPPYFAIRANTDFLDTIGGLKINERMEVIDKKGEPISGLYAAGVVAGGWQGDTYNVILSGAASGFAFNSGRIAAENAVSKIKNIKKTQE